MAGTLEVPLLDEFGDPVLDRSGDPVFETLADDAFAILAPGSSSGIGDPGELLAFNTTSGQILPPHSGEGSFSLDGLSLNMVEGSATVTMTTYRYTVAEDANADTPANSDYYYRLTEVDSFDFTADAATPAEVLLLSDVGFDDIFAVSFASDTGAAMVFDDILITV